MKLHIFLSDDWRSAGKIDSPLRKISAIIGEENKINLSYDSRSKIACYDLKEPADEDTMIKIMQLAHVIKAQYIQ